MCTHVEYARLQRQIYVGLSGESPSTAESRAAPCRRFPSSLSLATANCMGIHTSGHASALDHASSSLTRSMCFFFFFFIHASFFFCFYRLHTEIRCATSCTRAVARGPCRTDEPSFPPRVERSASKVKTSQVQRGTVA